MSQKDPDKKKSPLRKYAELSGIGFQMAATIFVCAWIGRKLDQHFQTQKEWFTIGFVLFGVFASLYLVIQQLKAIKKRDRED